MKLRRAQSGNCFRISGQTERRGDHVAIWCFWIYSFLGYLLEKSFAKLTHAELQGRKCFLCLPLCPVYGLGMLAVLAAPQRNVVGQILWGAVAATAVEYVVHWLYEALFRVRFWDYSNLPGNLHGRVCLPFSVIWGGLTAGAVWLLQPGVKVLSARVPGEITWLFLQVFTVDALLSAKQLWKTGDPESLRADRWRN